MSYGDSPSDLQRKILYLEAENKQYREELEQYKTQFAQYKSVNDSQQTALKDKDALLDQLREVNQSLENDVKTLKQFQSRSGSGNANLNPWSDGGMAPGTEPEQYRKLFVGGLDYNTKENGLRDYFGKYGEVEKASIVLKNEQSRGFGFVIFKSASTVDEAQEARPHTVEGRRVDTKRALPKDEAAENTARVKKLFVGGLGRDTKECDVKDYFEKFGNFERVEMQVFKDTGKSRGFAFIFFDDYDTVDKLVLIKQHIINGSICTVKKAVPMERYWSDRKFGQPGGGNNQSQGSFGGKQGNYGSNQGNYSGNQGSYNGNQGNYAGGNQGQGSYGGSQGSYGAGNQGSYGGSNQGSYGGSSNQGSYGGNQGGSNQGNYGGTGSQSGGNQGNFGGNQDNQQGQSGGGNMSDMMTMMSAFCNQYMSSQGGSGSSSSGAGPVRSTGNHQSRPTGPYNST